jgi:hypothetical protein
VHRVLTSLEFTWLVATCLGWATIAILGEAGLEGFAVGVLQWWVLRRRTGVGPLWGVLTGAVWWSVAATPDEVFELFGMFGPDLLRLSVVGLVVGALQWLLLGAGRDRTLLWIPINGASAYLSWGIGWTVGAAVDGRWYNDVATMCAGGAAGGAVAGVITGAPLRWLLRHRWRDAACSVTPRA